MCYFSNKTLPFSLESDYNYIMLLTFMYITIIVYRVYVFKHAVPLTDIRGISPSPSSNYLDPECKRTTEEDMLPSFDPFDDVDKGSIAEKKARIDDMDKGSIAEKKAKIDDMDKGGIAEKKVEIDDVDKGSIAENEAKTDDN